MSAVQQALIATVGLAFVFRPTISANTTNYNLKAAAIAAGWNQITPLDATVTVNSGVYVSATNTSNIAFDTGVTFPAGTRLSLVNNGFIIGMGGAGGTGGDMPAGGQGVVGSAGGLALRAQAPISINNASGTIGGGGGGGGGGGSGSVYEPYYGTFVTGGGGGGGGRSGQINSGGGGGGFNGVGGFNDGVGAYVGATGSPGTAAAAGGGGAGSPPAANGGSGGGWGSSGNSGGTSNRGGGGGGGSAGAAVNGNSNITWVNTGTRLGAIT